MKRLSLLILVTLSFTVFAASGLSIDEYIELYDTNGDRVLSIEEFPIREVFADMNGDGVMDHEEILTLTQRFFGRKFEWVNELPADHGLEGVRHATFVSRSMGIPAGYCIYLPPAYAAESDERFPVVYVLHGGRPGDETHDVGLAKFIHEAMASGEVAPAIYVFVNGGPVSHYNYTGKENALAVDVFVKELIPHIDANYRTIAGRRGRALQGFSQGGRGATRIMFEYPELFSSAAPGGSGYAVEKKISENAGLEQEDRLPGVAPLQFAPDENAFDRAREYAQDRWQPSLDILIWVGTEGLNYEATLEYMGFLYGLGIPFERLVVPDAGHDPFAIYEAAGIELMKFHDARFSRSPERIPDWGRRIEWDAEAAPEEREHASFILDPGRDRAVMLLGSGYKPYLDPLGDAWAYDLSEDRWSELELEGDTIAPGGSRRAARVPGGALIHGGYGKDMAFSSDLWELRFEDTQVRVEVVEQENAPEPRALHGFAADAAGERFVIFGGGAPSGVLDDTWIGSRTDKGVSWRNLDLEVGPGRRYGFSFAHDEKRGLLIVCGGQVPSGNGTDAFARDTWALDFTSAEPKWTLLGEYGPREIPGRRNPAFTFDEQSGDLLIWGGAGDAVNVVPDLFIVRTREEGAPVQRVPQPASIPARASGFGVVDTKRSRALLGFGNIETGPFLDLVEVRLGQ